MNSISSPIPLAVGNAARCPIQDPIEELPVAYVEVDASGVITRSNRAARRLHSADAHEIVGMHAWDFSPEGQADLDRNTFFSTMNEGVDPPITRRSLYSNGEFRTYELHRTLIRDAQGRTVGLRAATFDVTEAQVAEQNAHQARMWLESVLDSMPEAIILIDSLGFIRTVNPATEAMFGWKASELEGRVIEQAFPLLAYCVENNPTLTFNMALQTRSKGIATLIDREGRQLPVEISTAPIVDKANGYIIGVVSVLRKVPEASISPSQSLS